MKESLDSQNYLNSAGIFKDSMEVSTKLLEEGGANKNFKAWRKEVLHKFLITQETLKGGGAAQDQDSISKNIQTRVQKFINKP